MTGSPAPGVRAGSAVREGDGARDRPHDGGHRQLRGVRHSVLRHAGTRQPRR